jgi:hypothetical protein
MSAGSDLKVGWASVCVLSFVAGAGVLSGWGFGLGSGVGCGFGVAALGFGCCAVFSGVLVAALGWEFGADGLPAGALVSAFCASDGVPDFTTAFATASIADTILLEADLPVAAFVCFFVAAGCPSEVGLVADGEVLFCARAPVVSRQIANGKSLIRMP